MSQRLENLRQAAVTSSLRQCRMFAGLPADDLQTIAEFTEIRSLARGQYLFREGDPVAGFYVLQRGAINVHRVNPAGKEQVIRIFRPGESFAEAALATGRGYPADARSEAASQVLTVRKDGFIDLLRNRPDLTLRLLASMSMHLADLVGQLEDLTLKDVETRLAHWLLRQCPDPRESRPVPVTLHYTKRVLAAELGTVSETLSRTLAKFKAMELLTVEGSRLTVLNPARLEQTLQRHLGG